MNRVKTHVNKNDIVRVVTGNHRGAEGKVLQVLRAKNQVLIEGVRMIKKHTRKSQDHPNGAIVQKEGPIHISNVKRVETAKKEDAKPKTKAKAK
ncbi:MAG: 50S ribosomal protein L24 [Chthoniobacterales bacterium]|jgi:large subunit ribosomal protein L24|nr:50S ribosomal protein L24 [Chthoniobacterales bacterium]